jgi:hypothetical protein
MMNRIFLLSLTLLISSLSPSYTLAEIYRWIDENGKTQFSDRPVRGKVSSEVTVDTTKNAYGGGEVLNRQRDLLDRYEEQDQQAQKDRQQEAQDKEKQQQLKSACLGAKDKLTRYERSLIYTLDDQGERVYYSEEKRAQTIEDYRAGINKNCQ